MKELNQTTTCPTRETLESLIDGTLEEIQGIEEHLQSCESCQSILDSLSQSDFLRPFRKNEKYHTERSAIRFLDNPTRSNDLGTVGQFHIEAVIGRGGAGVVFRGFDPDLKRTVAIKVLSSDGSFRSEARFERESQVAAKVRNDHVVDVHTTGKTSDGRPYIVMPLISGDSLKQVLSNDLPSEKEVGKIISEIATGLHAIHDAGIIHRDVKPANILIDDSDGRAKLTDFGLAQDNVAGMTLTEANVLCGTPDYMSPEQSQGQEITAQSDVYSLGITLYECLTGTTPFRGGALNILQQHCNVDPIRPRQINPRISKNMETICLKSISKEPGRRYQTASEFADDMQRNLTGKPILARESSWWEKLILWSKRNRKVALLTATSAALLAALGVGSSLAALNLKQANDRIVSEKEKVADAEQRAVQDRAAAVNALNELVDSVFDDLSDNSATVEAREKLIQAAMKGLQSVSGMEGDDATNRTEFVAHRRMGHLMQLKGESDASEERYRQAIAIARKSVQTRPDDDRWKLDLAAAISELGVLLRSKDVEQSSDLNNEALTILEDLLERDANYYDALISLVSEKNYQLELIRSPNNQQVIIERGKEVLPDVQRLIEYAKNINPDKSSIIFQATYLIHYTIGRAYQEINDPHNAKPYFETAREHIDLGLAERPNNFYLQTAKATLGRALSLIAGSLGDMQESLAMFESSLAVLREVVASNPDNVRLKSQLAGSLSLGSETLLYSQKFERAFAALDESETIWAELIEISPDNEFYKVVFTENRLRMTHALMRKGRWEEAYETAVDTLEYLKNMKSKTQASSVFHQRNQFNNLIQSAGWLTNRPPESPNIFGKVGAIMSVVGPELVDATSLDLPPVTLALLKGVEPEFSGTTYQDLFLTLNEMVKDIEMFQAQSVLGELGVYSVIAKNCSEIADEEMQARSEYCLQHCLKILETKNPKLIVLKGIPDLKWLLDQPEAQSILLDLQQTQQAE